MPRPRKCRRVCRLPQYPSFTPDHAHPKPPAIILSIDEYETIRLIDKEGLSQEECGLAMNVARTTIQQIYTLARKKIADAIVEGFPIEIHGGDYVLCHEVNCENKLRSCHQRCKKDKMKEDTMKIAIPLDENKKDVCQVLARAPYFLIIENDSETIIDNPAQDANGGAGVLVGQFLQDQSIDVLITPRCGSNVAEILQASNVEIYQSQSTFAKENIEAYLNQQLELLTHFHGGYHGIQ